MGWVGDIVHAGGKALKWGLPAVLAPFTGGASLAAYGAYSTSSATKKANETNVQLARENRDWEERMSNTSYQRAVQDMQGAGLNPMLAYSQGGASTPNSSAATVAAAPMARVSDIISANSARMQQLQKEQLEAQTELIRQNATSVELDNNQKAWDAPYNSANAADKRAKIQADAAAAMQQVKNLQQQWERDKQDLDLKRRLQDKVVEAQELVNQAAKYDLPEKRTSAQWYESALGGGGRISNMLKDLLQLQHMLRGGK